jgi:hypothetical protein
MAEVCIKVCDAQSGPSILNLPVNQKLVAVSYSTNFGLENEDIGAGNSYFWNSNLNISIS